MTKTEIRILQTLWESEEALCAADIISKNPDLKEITVRTSLKNMLKSKMISVDGITQRTKSFARTFTANVTPEEIYCKEFLNSSAGSSFKFASALLKDENLSEDELIALKALIDERISK